MGFEPLGNLLKKNIGTRTGVSRSVEAGMVVAAATEEFTRAFPALAARMVVVSFRDGVLTMHAYSGSAAAELRLREPQFLSVLRTRLGAGVVIRLRYR